MTEKPNTPERELLVWLADWRVMLVQCSTYRVIDDGQSGGVLWAKDASGDPVLVAREWKALAWRDRVLGVQPSGAFKA